MIKSTTNTIALIVVCVTGIMVLYALIFGAEEIAPEVLSAWSGIIGWVVGAKSSKSKYQREVDKDEYIGE